MADTDKCFWCGFCKAGPFDFFEAADHAAGEHEEEWFDAMDDAELIFVLDNFTEKPAVKKCAS